MHVEDVAMSGGAGSAQPPITQKATDVYNEIQKIDQGFFFNVNPIHEA
jgi:hypothetical protein